MDITVDRCRAADGSRYVSNYHVAEDAVAGMTVMDLLRYLTENVDPTLGYYSHSVCNHGICKRCAVCVNGETVQACTTAVKIEKQLHLSPAGQRQPVRDLVVRL